MAMTPLTKGTVPTVTAEPAVVAPGRGPLAVVRRHPLGSFFVLVFALTWLIQIPSASIEFTFEIIVPRKILTDIA